MDASEFLQGKKKQLDESDIDPIEHEFNNGAIVVQPYYEQDSDVDEHDYYEYRNKHGETRYSVSRNGGERAGTALQRAKTYGMLVRILSSNDAIRTPRKTDSDRDVPAKIATEGNAVVAAYLYAVHELSVEDIASITRMDMSTATISQYLSDIRAGRRPT